MASVHPRATKSGTAYRVYYRTEDGTQKVKSFNDERRAERWALLVEVDQAAALRLLEQPETKPEVPTVTEWVRAHIDLLTGVTEGTKRDYRSQVAFDLAAHPIGLIRVSKLTRADVATWVNWLERARELKGKTIRNRHGLLSAAMSRAVEDGHAPANPCRGMRMPRTSHTDDEHVYLSHEEFATLLGAIAEHYRPLVLTLVGTGMRLGEATALIVGDVDVERNEIRIRRAFKRTGKTPEIGTTKSRRSDRTVAAPPQVIEALRPLIAGRRPTDRLLVSKRGTEIRQSWFHKRYWRPAVWRLAGDEVGTRLDKRGRPERYAVTEGPGPHPRIHDLRHTFASWAIRNGVPLPVIQRQLGHESIKTTIDTYGHLARSDFAALAAATATMLPPLLTDRPE